jgi:hypothetical protein
LEDDNEFTPQKGNILSFKVENRMKCLYNYHMNGSVMDIDVMKYDNNRKYLLVAVNADLSIFAIDSEGD